MSRLALVSAPKSFGDPRMGMLQSNAVGSWARLEGVDIILAGGGKEIAELARKNGAAHHPGVRTNTTGTPLIPSMLELGRQTSDAALLGIINADMVMMGEFVQAALVIAAKIQRFLMLGRRWDVDVDTPIKFESGWEERLREHARTSGRLHRPTGSDFFVFPRHLYADLPEFAIGRAGWDNWMIFSARRNGIPVVDVTQAVMAVHQNHDYAHLPGGQPHYGTPETAENIRLAGGTAAIRYSILDATHQLRGGRLRRFPMSVQRILREIELMLRRVLFFLPPATLENLVRPKRWARRYRRGLNPNRAVRPRSGTRHGARSGRDA